MSAAQPLHRSRRLPVAAIAGAALASVAAGVGAFALTAPGPVRDPASREAAAPAPAVPSTARLQTRFGAVSVDHAVRLTGSRRPMGVRVEAGELPIQVAVTVTNIRDRAVRVPPSTFRLEDARHGGIDPGRATDFRVPARSGRRFLLRYAVPDGVALPDLVVREKPGSAPMRVGLGRTDELNTLNVATHHFGGSGR